MARIRMPRHILPFVGIAALALAIWFVMSSQPDRQTTAPAIAPPTAPQAQAGRTVSGAGVVEPSSELIEVGAQRPGLVTNVAVAPGDRVSRGQLLFTIDARDASSRLGEAKASVELARERVDQARVDLASAQRQYSLFTSVRDPRAVAEQQVIDRRNARDQARPVSKSPAPSCARLRRSRPAPAPRSAWPRCALLAAPPCFRSTPAPDNMPMRVPARAIRIR
jgi:multidrug efflux pump subunit AcrA (membrane-fusion protein)